MQSRARLRGSSVLPAWNRLDRAAQTFAGLAPRLAGPAAGTVPEALAAERTLRDLGERTAAVERARQANEVLAKQESRKGGKQAPKVNYEKLAENEPWKAALLNAFLKKDE